MKTGQFLHRMGLKQEARDRHRKVQTQFMNLSDPSSICKTVLLCLESMLGHGWHGQDFKAWINGSNAPDSVIRYK